jgi:hypothetical protein
MANVRPSVKQWPPSMQRHRPDEPGGFQQSGRGQQAALKCLYLVTRSLDPTGTGKARWALRWKPARNAFAVTFGDRFPAAEAY